jgi:hypothetical protein
MKGIYSDKDVAKDTIREQIVSAEKLGRDMSATL